jgi:type I restriction enzyme M protein
MANFQEKADFIWGLADMRRGDYLWREYPDVILPMVVIRRLDLAMATTREAVRQAAVWVDQSGFLRRVPAFHIKLS